MNFRSPVVRVCFWVFLCFMLIGNSSSPSKASDEPLSRAKLRVEWWETESQIKFTQIAPVESIEAAQTDSINAVTDWWSVAHAMLVDDNFEIVGNRYGLANFNVISNHPADDTEPQLNYDGTRIVFTSNRDGNREIYVMDNNGSNQTRLTIELQSDNSPVWSPDGRQIAFVSKRDGNSELYLINANGSNSRRLTVDLAHDIDPDWSPDGRQLVWVKVTGKETGVLWAMNADGSNQRPVSRTLYYPGNPRWSPDGNNIAFDAASTPTDVNQISLLASDGSAVVVDPGIAGGVEEHWNGAWLPNGHGLLFTSLRYDIVDNAWQLTAVNLRQLCFDTTDGRCPNPNANNAYLLLSPTVVSLDKIAPTSFVRPLPQFTRFTQFMPLWFGQDGGPSGLAAFDIEYRRAEENAWQTWYYQTTYTAGEYYHIQPGKYYFRSRAFDNAQNAEAQPTVPDGDTSTTIYVSSVTGRITDIRGFPRRGQNVEFSAAPLHSVMTDVSGSFKAHFAQNEQTVMSGSSPLILGADLFRDLTITPGHNLIQNGSFEMGGLTGWKSMGAIEPVITTSSKENTVTEGQHALQLGIPCPAGCTKEVEIPLNEEESPSSLSSWRTRIVTSKDGSVHVFAGDSSSGLAYYQRTARGEWLARQNIYIDSSVSWFEAVLDEHNIIHLAWQTRQDEVYYGYQMAGGGWSAKERVAIIGESPQLALDSTGTVHLIFGAYTHVVGTDIALFYTHKRHSDVWSTPIQIGTFHDFGLSELVVDYYSLAVDKTDQLFVFWPNAQALSPQESLREIVVRSRSLSGKWSQPLPIGAVDRFFFGIRALNLPSGQIHLFWPIQSMLHHTFLMENGAWAEPELLNNNDYCHVPVVSYDLAGNLHYICQDGHRFRLADGTWGDRTVHESHSPELAMGLATPRSNDLIVAWGNYATNHLRLMESIRATETTDSLINQTITIPISLHEPTLSFMYQTKGSATGQSYFEVTVTDPLSSSNSAPTQVFSTTQATHWKLGWVDMSDWQGRTVTVTFQTHQAISDTIFNTQLDQISLAAWMTPVATELSTQQVEAGIESIISIRGTNFVEPVTVKVGGVVIEQTTLQDKEHIQVTLPSSLSAGTYDITIINADGTATVVPSALTIGKQIFLPVISQQ